VRFAAGLATLVSGAATALLEVGPGSALANLAQQGAGTDGGRTIVASLPGGADSAADLTAMLSSLGRMWAAGVQPDWRAQHASNAPRRISLPTYPFERTHHPFPLEY
jgi:acyl transferase domain-containing protein